MMNQRGTAWSVGAEQGRDRCCTEISRFLYIRFGVAKSLIWLDAPSSDSGGFSVHGAYEALPPAA